MLTNQTIVLRALYWKGKKMNSKEISKVTGLKMSQVTMAVYTLKHMRYIKTELIPLHYINGVRITNASFSELAHPILAEKTLKKRGAI